MLLLTSLVMQFLSCTVSFLFWQLLIAFYISTHTVLILIVLSHVIYKHEYLILYMCVLNAALHHHHTPHHLLRTCLPALLTLLDHLRTLPQGL
jgi:hypothetical protein